MKNTPRHRYTIYLTLLAMVMGCGEAEKQCTFDSDCSDERACVLQQCLKLCQGDEDCKEDDDDDQEITCQPYAKEKDDETVSVCALPDQLVKDNNPNTDCQSDTQCQEKLGDMAARCSVSNTCFIPRQENAIYIEDTSTSLDGVIILAAYLENKDGQTIGYGVSEGHQPAQVTQKYQPLTGAEPKLTVDGQCTQDTTNPHIPLGGKGGVVQLSFVNQQGQRLTLEPSWKMVILSYQENCAPELMFDHEYSAKLCVLHSGEQLDPDKHCKQALGSSTMGVARFDLGSTN